MTKALGMIETRGLIASIEAADAMVKAADVQLVNQEKVDAALVTILVEGDVSAVQAAVEAGKEAAEKVGTLISSYVIPNPDESTRGLLKKNTTKLTTTETLKITDKEKRNKENEKSKSEIPTAARKRTMKAETTKKKADSKSNKSNEKKE